MQGRNDQLEKLCHERFSKSSIADDPFPKERMEGKVVQGGESQEVHVTGRCFSKVANPSKPPYQAIGIVTGSTSSKDVKGTGALIAAHLVLTCAHNCYYKSYDQHGNEVYKEEVSNLRFYPSPSGGVTKVVKVKRAHYTDEYVLWSEKASKRYDFAILELEEDLSKEYGYFGIDSSAENIVPQKQTLVLAGYPISKQYYPPNVDNLEAFSVFMYEDANEMFEIEKGLIKYKIQSEEGNSGGPLFKYDQGKYYIVGIHIAGDSTK